MSKQIVWSRSSESDFANILEYLQENWEERITNQFIELVDILRIYDTRQDPNTLIFK